MPDAHVSQPQERMGDSESKNSAILLARRVVVEASNTGRQSSRMRKLLNLNRHAESDRKIHLLAMFVFDFPPASSLAAQPE